LIYQLCAFLRTKFPTEIIYENGRVRLASQEEIPDRNILVTETGGVQQAWTGYKSQIAQIITRDIDQPKSRQLSYLIFAELNDRFGLILPTITVGGEVFPIITTAQINANGIPYYFGTDSNGLHEYLTNYRVIYEV
jgi:hypothetical protein